MSRTSWCTSCMKTQEIATTDLGHICCTICGKVIPEDIYFEEPQFGKNGCGALHSGKVLHLSPYIYHFFAYFGMSSWFSVIQKLVHVSIVRTVASEDSASRERTLNRGLQNMTLTGDLRSNSGWQRNGDGSAGTSPGFSYLNHSKTGSGQLITSHVSNTSDPTEGL